MINYTERIQRLMQDVVWRTPRLGYIDLSDVLVFGRFGRPGADGAFATCHCLTLPETEPGYYFWRDRETGELTRRSEWFVTKTPEVSIRGRRIKYLISFVLPRFCEQSLARSWKSELYGNVEPWVAKLDTIIHELYHIDPGATGIRQVAHANGTRATRTHGPEFDGLPRVETRPGPARVPALGLRQPAGSIWFGDGDDVQQLSVVSAALHGAVHGAARRGGRGRESGAGEAAQPAAALHRARPQDPRVHQRRDHAAAARVTRPGDPYSTRRAPTNRADQ